MSKVRNHYEGMSKEEAKALFRSKAKLMFECKAKFGKRSPEWAKLAYEIAPYCLNLVEREESSGPLTHDEWREILDEEQAASGYITEPNTYEEDMSTCQGLEGNFADPECSERVKELTRQEIARIKAKWESEAK